MDLERQLKDIRKQRLEEKDKAAEENQEDEQEKKDINKPRGSSPAANAPGTSESSKLISRPDDLRFLVQENPSRDGYMPLFVSSLTDSTPKLNTQALDSSTSIAVNDLITILVPMEPSYTKLQTPKSGEYQNSFGARLGTAYGCKLVMDKVSAYGYESTAAFVTHIVGIKCPARTKDTPGKPSPVYLLVLVP